MKTIINKIVLIGFFVLLVRSGNSQSFINLNFEQAKNLGSPESSVAATNAFPGWTVSISTANILYDNATLGSPSADILDANSTALFGSNPVIQGNYTAALQGTVSFSGGISQTGLIPASTATLLFSANGISQFSTLTVSLNGQNLNYIPLSTGSNFTLYGADISMFSNQTATLMFSSSATIPAAANFVSLDNIQFSTSPVPEPDELSLSALCVLGSLFLNTRRRRKVIL